MLSFWLPVCLSLISVSPAQPADTEPASTDLEDQTEKLSSAEALQELLNQGQAEEVLVRLVELLEVLEQGRDLLPPEGAPSVVVAGGAGYFKSLVLRDFSLDFDDSGCVRELSSSFLR